MDGDHAAAEARAVDAREACGVDHVGEQLGAETCGSIRPDSGGRAVPGDDLADRGNDGEGLGVVEPVEPRQVDPGEFEAEESAAALEHPIGLGQRLLDARHVADAEGDRIGVEARSANGSSSALASTKRTRSSSARCAARSAPTRSISGLMSATVTWVRGRRPGRRGRRRRRCRRRHRDGRTGRGARTDLCDENVLPQPMQAGHQIVHQVVAPGDLVEHLVDEALPLASGTARRPKWVFSDAEGMGALLRRRDFNRRLPGARAYGSSAGGVGGGLARGLEVIWMRWVGGPRLTR